MNSSKFSEEIILYFLPMNSILEKYFNYFYENIKFVFVPATGYN